MTVTTTHASSPLAGLVLTCAVGPDEGVRAAWIRATSLEPIEEWPGELARPLPAIFRRLEGQSDVPHYAILRGAFRASWSSNMVRLRSAMQVMTALADRSIPYRMIKGGAVCGRTQSWGTRRMGDIDIIIPESSSRACAAILTDLGFRQRVPAHDCGGLWEDSRSGIVDIHPTSRGRGPLAYALRDEPWWIEALGYRVAIPAPEVCIAIAAGHARQGAATSDRIQALLDLHQLLPLCDPLRLAGVLDGTGESASTALLVGALREAGSCAGEVEISIPPLRIASLLSAAAARPRSIRRRAQALVHRPRLRVGEVSRLRRTSSISTAHAGWLTTGQPRPLERWWMRRAGGFLPLPPVMWHVGASASVAPEPAVTADDHISCVRIPGVEDRLRIHTPRARWLRIRLTLDLNGPPPMIFVNGIMYGYAAPIAGTECVIDVQADMDSLEISVRSGRREIQGWSRITLTLDMAAP